MGVSKRSNNCGVILLPNNCGRWIVILKKNFCTFAKLTFLSPDCCIVKTRIRMESTTFHTLLTSLRARMLDFAYGLTSNRDDANDLVQDTMLKALDNSDKFTDNVNFKGWVFTIMRNIFVNDCRRMMHSVEIIDRSIDGYRLNIPLREDADSPEGVLSVSEMSTAIRGLEDKYREPFAMHVAGYKYNEIADRLGLPIGTVKSRIFSARQCLKEQFSEYL